MPYNVKAVLLQFGSDDISYEPHVPQGQMDHAPYTTLSVRIVKTMVTNQVFTNVTDKNDTHFIEHITKMIGKDNLYPHVRIKRTMLKTELHLGEMVQMQYAYAYVYNNKVDAALAKAGKEGVIVQRYPFCAFTGISPLPLNTTIEDACALSDRLGAAVTRGVVPTKLGWSIRADNADLPRVHCFLHADLTEEVGETLMMMPVDNESRYIINNLQSGMSKLQATRLVTTTLDWKQKPLYFIPGPTKNRKHLVVFSPHLPPAKAYFLEPRDINTNQEPQYINVTKYIPPKQNKVHAWT